MKNTNVSRPADNEPAQRQQGTVRGVYPALGPEQVLGQTPAEVRAALTGPLPGEFNRGIALTAEQAMGAGNLREAMGIPENAPPSHGPMVASRTAVPASSTSASAGFFARLRSRFGN